MKSEHFIEQFKVWVLSAQAGSPEDRQLLEELSHRHLDTFIKPDSIEKLPEIVTKINPQQFGAVIINTAGVQPTQPLIEAINRLQTTNTTVIFYPAALPTSNPNVVVAPQKWQLFEYISQLENRANANAHAMANGQQVMMQQPSPTPYSPPSNLTD